MVSTDGMGEIREPGCAVRRQLQLPHPLVRLGPPPGSAESSDPAAEAPIGASNGLISASLPIIDGRNDHPAIHPSGPNPSRDAGTPEHIALAQHSQHQASASGISPTLYGSRSLPGNEAPMGELTLKYPRQSNTTFFPGPCSAHCQPISLRGIPRFGRC